MAKKHAELAISGQKSSRPPLECKENSGQEHQQALQSVPKSASKPDSQARNALVTLSRTSLACALGFYATAMMPRPNPRFPK